MQNQEELSIKNRVNKNPIGITEKVEVRDTKKIKDKGIKQTKVLSPNNSIHTALLIQKYLIKTQFLNPKYKYFLPKRRNYLWHIWIQFRLHHLLKMLLKK